MCLTSPPFVQSCKCIYHGRLTIPGCLFDCGARSDEPSPGMIITIIAQIWYKNHESICPTHTHTHTDVCVCKMPSLALFTRKIKRLTDVRSGGIESRHIHTDADSQFDSIKKSSRLGRHRLQLQHREVWSCGRGRQLSRVKHAYGTMCWIRVQQQQRRTVWHCRFKSYTKWRMEKETDF